MVVAAINADQSVPYCPLNIYNPRGSVLNSSVEVTINGQKNDFHEFTNVKIASDASPGFDIGKIILAKIPYLLHPSIFAASSISTGMDKKNCLNINTPKAVNAGGTVKAA